ncbi:MAG: DNA primase, partial [Candidatus Methanosuratincola petrocarbonis]
PKHSKIEGQAVTLPEPSEPQKLEVTEKLERPEPEKPEKHIEIPQADLEKLRSLVKELQGSLEGVLTDETWEVKQKVAVRELAELLQSSEIKPFAVIFDGVVTQRLLDVSNSKGVSYLIGARIGNIAKRPQNIKIMVFDDITK